MGETYIALVDLQVSQPGRKVISEQGMIRKVLERWSCKAPEIFKGNEGIGAKYPTMRKNVT